MTRIFAFGVGLASRSRNDEILDCYFPCPVFQPEAELAQAIAERFERGVTETAPEAVRGLADAVDPGALASTLKTLADGDRPLTAVRLDDDGPIESTPAAYLKLHLLSHRLTLPNTQNLDGIFAHLPNVAWTSAGPIAADEVTTRLVEARLAGTPLDVFAVDKFPRMTNYVVPRGVRIADASRIRLGAYLGEGTTVILHPGDAVTDGARIEALPGSED